MSKWKKMAALGMAFCMGAASLTGCGSSKSDTSTTTAAATETTGSEAASEATTEAAEVSEDDKYGGTLTIALASVASNIDPIKYTGVYEGQIIENVCDSLLVYDNNVTDFKPSLATEWVANDAGDEYTFTLRDDVYFQPGKYQDGRKMTFPQRIRTGKTDHAGSL